MILSQYPYRIPYFENMFEDQHEVDDGVAPSSLDIPKSGKPTESQVSGGGVY